MSLKDASWSDGAKPSSETVMRMFREGIFPNWEALEAIYSTGAIACLVFEPSEAMRTHARNLGWDGVSPVFESASMVEVMTASPTVDVIHKHWLAGSVPGRIYVIGRGGSLPMSFNPSLLDESDPGSFMRAFKFLDVTPVNSPGGAS